MALMDEFKEERKSVLQNGTIKQKISYIWDYYKWHIIIPIIVVIALISFIVNPSFLFLCGGKYLFSNDSQVV